MDNPNSRTIWSPTHSYLCNDNLLALFECWSIIKKVTWYYFFGSSGRYLHAPMDPETTFCLTHWGFFHFLSWKGADKTAIWTTCDRENYGEIWCEYTLIASRSLSLFRMMIIFPVPRISFTSTEWSALWTPYTCSASSITITNQK